MLGMKVMWVNKAHPLPSGNSCPGEAASPNKCGGWRKHCDGKSVAYGGGREEREIGSS